MQSDENKRTTIKTAGSSGGSWTQAGSPVHTALKGYLAFHKTTAFYRFLESIINVFVTFQQSFPSPLHFARDYWNAPFSDM